MPDWKRALFVSVVLLGIAAFIVIGIHPGGFEGQIGWFFGLLPGAFVAASISEHAVQLPAVLVWPATILIWPVAILSSFLWYFALSYSFIKAYRLVASHFSRPRKPNPG